VKSGSYAVLLKRPYSFYLRVSGLIALLFGRYPLFSSPLFRRLHTPTYRPRLCAVLLAMSETRPILQQLDSWLAHIEKSVSLEGGRRGGGYPLELGGVVIACSCRSVHRTCSHVCQHTFCRVSVFEQPPLPRVRVRVRVKVRASVGATARVRGRPTCRGPPRA